MAKIQLPDITVCVADSAHPRLAARALELSLAQCDFADAILFSDQPIEGSFRNVPIAPIDTIEDYSLFCLRTLPQTVTTPFVLIIQWDGYVTDAGAWADDFRDYDYIGAVWPSMPAGHRVGNGGFSLRSRKLLKALLELKLEERATMSSFMWPSRVPVPEDKQICAIWRQTLKKEFGIRFAPERVARRFSYEVLYPGHSTFGFHGLPNLWRHTTGEELLSVVRELASPQVATWQYLGLIFNCLMSDRQALARALYGRAREDRSSDAIESDLAKMLTRPVARKTIEKLETQYAGI